MTRSLPIWAAVAAADRYSADDREYLAAWARGLATAHPVRAALVTCHRVELYGLGDPDDAPADSPLAAADVPCLTGEAAVRHLFRLATGLESAVIGEDQVLAQVRATLAALRVGRSEAGLVRVFELAVGAGRRARAGYVEADRDLGEAAARWLESRAGSLRGEPVLVAGAGVMGRLLAAALARRQSVLFVASHTPEHAAQLAERFGGRAMDLPAGAKVARSARAVAIALAGSWPAFQPGDSAPPTVDLSFPPAVDRAVRERLGGSFADVDRIFADARSGTEPSPVEAGFVARAEKIVDETLDAAARWFGGRDSVPALRSLRARAEQRRSAELEHLLRRLPDLAPQERGLVTAFSERLVATLLHEPTAALRDDVDGSAAMAAERLFRL